MNIASNGGAFAPPLLSLYFVSCLAGIASGLFNPLIATWMTQHGASDVTIGANSSVFFLFMMIAAPFAQGRSMRAALAIGLGLTALSAVQFPFYETPVAWFALRAAMGFGVGLYMIASQTALNSSVDDDQRALVGGFYGLAFGIGLGVGPLIGASLYAWRPDAAFVLGATVLAVGLPIAWPWLTAAPLQRKPLTFESVGLLSLPLHAVLAYGVAEATLLSLYPVYAAGRGLDVIEMSLGFSAFVAGGILATLPIAHLADRYGREALLLCCSAVGVAAMAGLILVDGALATAVASFLIGASLGPVFTVALALVGQTLSKESFSGGSALFTTAFGFGSMIGPVLGAVSMQYLGHAYMFGLSMLLFVGLALRLALRSVARRGAAA